jgi:hypothetical protein
MDSWERMQSRDHSMNASRNLCIRKAVLKRPNDLDRRKSASESFQTNQAAWLKTPRAISVLVVGTLSIHCDDYREFLVGA